MRLKAKWRSSPVRHRELAGDVRSNLRKKGKGHVADVQVEQGQETVRLIKGLGGEANFV